MKKLVILTLSLFIGLSGVAFASSTWKGFTIVQIFSSGKQLQATDTPAVTIQNRAYLPLYMLRQAGLDVTYDAKTKAVSVEVPQKSVQASQRVLTEDDIKLLSRRAVALIYAVDAQGKTVSQGSGFVATSDGLLLTAFHVAEEKGTMHDLKVILNGETYLIPKDSHVYSDKEKDLYAVKLPEGLYDYIPFNPSQLKEHDQVIALGYPKGNAAAVKGEVSYDLGGEIMFRMYVDHGGSGGALINQYGEAVGVIQTGADPELNIGVATGGKILQEIIK